MSVPDLDVPSSTFSAEPCARRVIEETETPHQCACENPLTTGILDPHWVCPQCHDTGIIWRVTSRRVQIGVPFEEQAAHAYIKGLHAHIRKAAKSVTVAADMLQQAGRTTEALETRKVAAAILEPVEGQD
jgi:hypothetical protein